jgi:hypothetical protein
VIHSQWTDCLFSPDPHIKIIKQTELSKYNFRKKNLNLLLLLLTHTFQIKAECFFNLTGRGV